MNTKYCKLYELNRGDKFKLAEYDISIPPDAPEPDLKGVYTFGNVDGMYSTSKGEDGETYYFAAWTLVERT
jgi:hypothetical protein